MVRNVGPHTVRSRWTLGNRRTKTRCGDVVTGTGDTDVANHRATMITVAGVTGVHHRG
jgi:hypothetical protein